MKPVKHTIAMIVAGIIFTILWTLIIDSTIADPAMTIGMALAFTSPGLFVMLIGLIMQLVSHPRWQIIIKTAWIVVIAINLVALIGNLSL
jgi:hypothetical protein